MDRTAATLPLGAPLLPLRKRWTAQWTAPGQQVARDHVIALQQTHHPSPMGLAGSLGAAREGSSRTAPEGGFSRNTVPAPERPPYRPTAPPCGRAVSLPAGGSQVPSTGPPPCPAQGVLIYPLTPATRQNHRPSQRLPLRCPPFQNSWDGLRNLKLPGQKRPGQRPRSIPPGQVQTSPCAGLQARRRDPEGNRVADTHQDTPTSTSPPPSSACLPRPLEACRRA